MDAKRGYVPEDARGFAPDSLQRMRTASRHVRYLINEGYGLKQASVFVGNHFLLSERQRLAIVRSVATDEQVALRRGKEVSVESLAGEEVWIDGFNTVITLEVLLCDSILLSCMDGTVRDLASLRGTYRLIPETEGAVSLFLDVLKEAKVRRAVVLRDEPVSNSGRLKAKIAERAEGYPFELDIRVQRDVDRELYGRERVVTSDSVILDRSKSWVNLVSACLRRRGGNPVRVWEEEEA